MTTTTLIRPVTEASGGVSTKSRRVRTGCLTCRERHLKCDETVPDCLNCRKSNRHCKRGVRLNFLEVNVHKPDYVALSMEWAVQFQDESREIASEYQDGISRYAPYDSGVGDGPKGKAEAGWAQARPSEVQMKGGITVERQLTLDEYNEIGFADPTPMSLSAMLPQSSNDFHHSEMLEMDDHANSEPDYMMPLYQIDRPSRRNTIQYEGSYPEQLLAVKEEAARQARRKSDASSATSMVPLATLPPPSPADGVDEDVSSDSSTNLLSSERPKKSARDFLSSPEEVYYMQVFVEKVGTWMDSFDKEKHFSRLIPYHALKSTMLLNAFLACGAKHLSLFTPEKEDKALFYYNTATTQLLRSLQNPDRNMAECATTAVVLNVYEIMSEKPAQRMSHIAGARALIRECGWDARSTGIGAACFWLNIGMEVLSCLSMDWITTWNPEHWGLHMDFIDVEDEAGVGQEEIWVHRIFYIVAKTVNFRATSPGNLKATAPFEHPRLSNRISQWQELKRLCDRWNNACPRTMHPLGYLRASKVGAKSSFPQVWMIKTAAIVGRLFYHTSQCILARTHPLESDKTSQEMCEMQLHHAHQVCGIIAHTEDPGIDSIAIRCLPVVGAVLVEPREQEEVLEILRKINSHSGWRLGMVEMELKKAWGWGRHRFSVPLFKSPMMGTPHTFEHQPNGLHFQAPAIPARPITPMTPYTTRISTPPVIAPVPIKAPVNPLSFADFSLPNHPYQNWYEPPNQAGCYDQRLL